MVATRSTLGHCKRALELEPGSGNGAGALWMADLMASFGIGSHVYSLDLEARRIAHDRVTFMAGDSNRIAVAFPADAWPTPGWWSRTPTSTSPACSPTSTPTWPQARSSTSRTA